MDDNLRQHYIDQVANFCNRLAAWKRDTISGVDGRQLLERYLLKGNSEMADALAPQQLLKKCTEMSMDVFYRCDLGPTNVLVDTLTGSLGIIGWELAGYVQNILKKTGAARSHGAWKKWATKMSWTHGGSFRTARRQ